MNERQAVQVGYVFTGAYSHNKEDMKDRAKKERARGNKAVVVNIPPNPLSRGSRGMGYSVYYIESETNKQAREKKQRIMKIRNMSAELNVAKAKVAELEDKFLSELASIPLEWVDDL
jgi:hypothetical protein